MLGSEEAVSFALRVVTRAVVALIVGACTVFVGVAATLLLSFLTATAVSLPGLVDAWTSEDDHSIGRALVFTPSFVGMGLAVVLVAVVYAAVRGRVQRYRARPGRADA